MLNASRSFILLIFYCLIKFKKRTILIIRHEHLPKNKDFSRAF